jgi:hypothetical protein
MEEADFECSLNSRLLTRPINVQDDWYALWCDSLDRYAFQSLVTGATKLDFPTPSITLDISSPWKISGGPQETSTAFIMDFLGRIYGNTSKHNTSENAKIRTCIDGLQEMI